MFLKFYNYCISILENFNKSDIKSNNQTLSITKKEKVMVCNYCFENKELNDYIKEQGSKATHSYQCSECQSLEDEMYLLPKDDLARKLQKIILTLYEHDNDLGMMHFAEKNICDEGEDPNKYAQLEDIYSVCYELFEDDTKIPEIIASNINFRDIQQGGDDLFSDTYNEVWKTKCWWDDEKFGLSQWQTFCENVKHRARYFNHKDFSVTNFLEKFENALKKIEHSENLTIYRARKINSLKEEITINSNPACELGKVPIQFAQNNRFSPIGISYGYFAMDSITAKKEIRTKDEDKIAIGKFRITDELKLIDFRFQTMKNKVNIFNDNLDLSLYCQQRFIKDFLQDISKPVKDNDQQLEYVPTQIMAEYIWHLGYDGFLFDSSQNLGGVNLVIFEAKYKFTSFEIKKG